MTDIEEVKKILGNIYMRGYYAGKGGIKINFPPVKDDIKQICQLFKPQLTPSLNFELEGMKPEYQDRLAELLNFANAMGDYGDPHGLLAVVSPISGKVLKCEKEIHEPQSDEYDPQAAEFGWF